MAATERSFFRDTLGPGLLFAGAAVGVSHLVQSTRAGATYGLGLLFVIVLANVFKYAAFSFGPRYAAATGTSLLEGYRRRGRFALALYSLLTLGTMFTVLAGVTVVTAGLARALFYLELDVVTISGILIALCALLLFVGHYHWLDKMMKVVVALLTVTTVVATVLVLPKIDWASMSLWPTTWDASTSSFVAPLVGWMPSAIDIAVWHSLWTLAKRRDTGIASTVKETLLDFKIGYWGTAFLAICFVLLGAGVMHGGGVPIAASSGGFANQVITLYTANLGEWSRYLIGGAALMVMFSTTLTVVDGFPRAIATLVERFLSAEVPSNAAPSAREQRVYWIAVIVMAGVAMVILKAVSGADFRKLLDLATAMSFLTAPILAILNHKSICGEEVPEGLRPGTGMRALSLVSIVLLSGFAVWWLVITYA